MTKGYSKLFCVFHSQLALWWNGYDAWLMSSRLGFQTWQKYFYRPPPMKLWPRLCFYSCLWLCPQGGSPTGRPPWQGGPPAGRPPAGTPHQGGTPQQGDTPGKEPPSAGRPPSRETPLARRTPPRHTVNERPVRILLKCILVDFRGFFI